MSVAARQSKERFRKLFRRVMSLFCDVFPFSKYGPMVVQALGSKNTRTKVESAAYHRCIVIIMIMIIIVIVILRVMGGPLRVGGW
jgi:hypothetical protein